MAEVSGRKLADVTAAAAAAAAAAGGGGGMSQCERLLDTMSLGPYDGGVPPTVEFSRPNKATATTSAAVVVASVAA